MGRAGEVLDADVGVPLGVAGVVGRSGQAGGDGGAGPGVARGVFALAAVQPVGAGTALQGVVAGQASEVVG